ncbi:MAG: phosphatidate cytidylyltransferase [Isosphaeraceae bacterium]
MLGTRVLSGLFLIAVLLGVLYLDEWLAPWFPLWFLFSVLALSAAAVELVGLLSTAGCGPSLNSVLGGVAAIVVANWVPHVAESLAERTTLSLATEPVDAIAVLSWPLLTFVGVLMVSFLVQSVQFVKPGRTMATIAGTILVIAYVGLLGSFIIQMRWLEGPRHGMVPLLLLMATAKGADTGAYSLGRLMGRNKLWPSLSPNKTVEGAIGGMVFAVACALLVRLATRAMLTTFTLGWLQTVGYGLLVGLAAQLGDLMESMIKRDCERKDASSAVPGFGGVLDVLDSLLFAGPVAYALWIAFDP